MRRLISSELAVALALPLLFASRAATAAPPLTTPPAPPAPKVLALWNTTDKGFFFTFSDAADGSLSSDSTYASQKQAQFSGISVVLFDNGALVLGTIQNNQLNAIAQLAEVNTKDLTYTLAHSKSADGKTFLDGTVSAATDLKTGFLELTLTEISQDGKSSKTTRIEFALSNSNPVPPA